MLWIRSNHSAIKYTKFNKFNLTKKNLSTSLDNHINMASAKKIKIHSNFITELDKKSIFFNQKEIRQFLEKDIYTIEEFKNFALQESSIPSTREWPDSVYTFDKSLTANIITKYNTTFRAIREFYYMFRKKFVKITRLRTLLIKRSSSKFFIGKPEIKQNNDKNIIMVQGLDRERQISENIVFHFFKIWKNGISRLRKIYIRKKINMLKLTRLVLKNKKNYIDFNSSFRFHDRSNKSRTRFSKTDLMKTYEGSFKEKLINILNVYNKSGGRMFNHFFFKYLLLCIGVQVDYIRHVNKNANKVTRNDLLSLLVNRSSISINLLRFIKSVLTMNLKYKNPYLYTSSRSVNDLSFNADFKSKILFYSDKIKNDLNRKQNINTNKSLRKIIHFQFKCLQLCVTFFFTKLSKEKYINKILLLNKLFSLQRSTNLFKRSNKIIRTLIIFICKLYFSFNKVSKYLMNIKIVVHKIYGKLIDIAFINITNPQLNSDIYMELLATKLTDRTRNASLYVQRSLGLTKIPTIRDYNFLLARSRDFAVKNYITSFNLYNFYNNNFNMAILKTLDHIRFKRITGVYLEAKGRLTNRYVIARSLSFAKNKGGLKNLDKLVNFSSITTLRNFLEPNIQYLNIQKKRLIGAFGLKAWVSSS